MGCSSSRPDSHPCEGSLTSIESTLLFGSRSVTQHYYALRRYSQSSPFLNDTAFRSAAQTMQIQITDSPANQRIAAFYAGLKSPQGLIRARDIAVLAVLLSDSSDEDKASVLFEAYDESYAKQLSKDTVQEMVTDLVTLSTEKISVMVDGKTEDKAAIDAYFGQIKGQRDSGISAFTQLIMDGKPHITSAEFQQSLLRPSVQPILSSNGVRRLLHSRMTTKPA